LNFKFLLYALILLIGVAILYGSCFAEGQEDFQLEIIAVTETVVAAVVVYLEPNVRNIEEPVRFEWLFGDGQESSEMFPLPHYYNAGGKYNVLLEVTNKAGKRYTASVTIDVASSIGGVPLCSMTQSPDN